MTTPAGVNRSDVERVNKWATDLINKHDKNGDMMLQAEEQADLGQSAQADTDGDGVITHNELVAFSLGRSAASASASGSTNSSSVAASAPTTASSRGAAPGRATAGRSREGGKTDAQDKRKSYRFTTPRDRLPAGLPSWFKTKDANGDGQVAMHEYSRTWTDRTAAEFARYDRNNDGVIAPDEARQR